MKRAVQVVENPMDTEFIDKVVIPNDILKYVSSYRVGELSLNGALES